MEHEILVQRPQEPPKPPPPEPVRKIETPEAWPPPASTAAAAANAKGFVSGEPAAVSDRRIADDPRLGGWGCRRGHDASDLSTVVPLRGRGFNARCQFARCSLMR